VIRSFFNALKRRMQAHIRGRDCPDTIHLLSEEFFMAIGEL
jgi:hypothetical protein